MPGNSGKKRSTGTRKPGSGKPIIVTIGASAGGVTALQRFFEAIPEPTGASFVVVVHLDPDRRANCLKFWESGRVCP
jgi:chemotaxis response regulator CheB